MYPREVLGGDLRGGRREAVSYTKTAETGNTYGEGRRKTH